MTAAEKKSNKPQTVRKSLPENASEKRCRMMIMISGITASEATGISAMILDGVYKQSGNADVNVDISGER